MSDARNGGVFSSFLNPFSAEDTAQGNKLGVGFVALGISGYFQTVSRVTQHRKAHRGALFGARRVFLESLQHTEGRTPPWAPTWRPCISQDTVVTVEWIKCAFLSVTVPQEM